MGSIIDRPRHDATTRGFCGRHEIRVNERPLPPEVAPADGEQGVERPHRIRHLQHASRKLWGEALGQSDLPVVKGVHGTGLTGRTERLQRSWSGSGTLQFGVSCESTRLVEGQDLVQGWCPRATGGQRVVVHPQHSVRVQVNVKLAAVSA